MAKAEVEKGVAKIVWKRSPDAVLVELERTPGINGRKKTIVYRGNGASFTDRTVRDGVRYRYEIRASDVAGNMVEKAVTANVDLPALYRPTAGAAVHAPLVLSWEAVKGAAFYNVQLYRRGVKVLTFWPKTPTLRIGKTWRYAGKLQRLAPGSYNWYVWGASGTLAQTAVRKGARQQLVRRQVALLEREAEPRELVLDEAALDRRLEVELLDDLRILSDQVAHTGRQHLVGLLPRLEQVEGAPALAQRVRDPRLEAQPFDLGELVDRLVAKVAAKLLDRGLRIGEAPEHDPHDHQNGPRGS